MPDKAALRRQLRESLTRLPAAVRTAASTALCQKLAAWPMFRQARVIALFHPTPTEPALLPLLDYPDKTFLFPLCHPDRTLTWHPPGHRDRWKPSRSGIIEPDPALDPPVPHPAFELILVPGLAFTLTGDRLGHGAGFYDRFLASLPPAIPTAGVCFACQIQPLLPTETHDIRVQQVFHA